VKPLLVFTLIALVSAVSQGLSIERPLENVSGRFSRQLQGLCHDGDSVYVVQRYRVWKITKDQLAHLKKVRHDDLLSSPIPKKFALRGFDHMGDCDASNGRVFIAMDGGSPAKVLILDARTLEVLAAPDIPSTQKGISWVAVDRTDQSLLIGQFEFNRSTPQFHRLKLSDDLRHLSEIESFSLLERDGRSVIQVGRVQAVEVDSSRRKLYLLSDVAEGGVLKFDLDRRTLEERMPIPFRPPADEIEGLDVLERGEPGPYPFTGRLFVLMNHKTFFGLDGRLNLFVFE